ncbi:MAG: hypothetical protein GOVbin140_52 [Prokaryotic dsDNA virus sp.]|nr:MAG: hypothetical protein GOVbin140_52 [Prokaryotic dsDNA virus sp.]|tara:strand:+ start:5393 stop:5989 length:597 start_codon:yes stop_codon:yes gene_type:complete
MNNTLAIDIETKNYSHEIGGWDNTHMFKVSTVCTWDGDKGTIYIDKAVDELKKSNVSVKPISELKYDLDDHLEKGTFLLGHNIQAFDLPVLRDALDIYCINKYISKKQYIDTSKEVTKSTGQRYSLNNLATWTLDNSKLYSSEEAPILWKDGKYSEVAKYCLKDCELVYDLWKHGVDNGIVKGFSLDEELEKEIEVIW